MGRCNVTVVNPPEELLYTASSLTAIVFQGVVIMACGLLRGREVLQLLYLLKG